MKDEELTSFNCLMFAILQAPNTYTNRNNICKLQSLRTYKTNGLVHKTESKKSGQDFYEILIIKS